MHPCKSVYFDRIFQSTRAAFQMRSSSSDVITCTSPMRQRVPYIFYPTNLPKAGTNLAAVSQTTLPMPPSSEIVSAKVALGRRHSGKISLLPKPIFVPRDCVIQPAAQPVHLGAGQTLVCGFFAGCVTRTSVAPLDVVKIVMQLKGMNGYTRTTGMLSTITQIYHKEGIRGFWKGNLAGCSRLAPYSASKFLVYDTCKHHAGGSIDNSQRLVFGAFAGMVATLVSYPMELVRTKLIVQTPENRVYRGMLDGIRQIYTTEGLRGLYRGGNSALIGVMPFEGIQFACYEALKEKAEQKRWPKWRWHSSKTQMTPVDYLVLGSLSGMVAQTIAYPLDSIKKRLQAQAGHRIEYRGMAHCVQVVMEQHGIRGLYHGLGANMIRIIPYSALMFTSYEYFKKFITQL